MLPRPDDPRQDRRRRAAARRLRRPRRDHGAARAGGRRLPGGHALGEPARDRGRPLGAAAAARPGASTRSSSGVGALLEEGLAPFGRVQRVGAMLTLFAGDERGRVRSAQRPRRGPLRARSSATCSRAGVYVAPSQYECLFPSLAHGEAEIEATVAAVAELRAVIASEGGGRGSRGTPETIASEARAESPLWAAALRDRARVGARLLPARARSASRSGSRRSTRPTSSTTAARASSSPARRASACCSATTSTRTASCAIAEAGGVDAVAAMAELISRCAALRAAGEARRRRRLGRGGARRSAASPAPDAVAEARSCAITRRVSEPSRAGVAR